MQVLAPEEEEYPPAKQLVHTAAPIDEEYVPAGQRVQDRMVTNGLVILEKVPATHGVQLKPFADTMDPAAQSGKVEVILSML